MSGIFKKIKWLINNTTGIVLGKLLSLIIKRKRNYVVFSAYISGQKKDYFMHNTKYLYMYLCKKNNIHTTFLCNDKNIIKVLNNYGYNNVYSRSSLKGIYLSLKSKYWFYDLYTSDLPKHLINNATLINLWHGAGGLKKVGADAIKRDKKSFQNKIIEKLTVKDSYFIINSEYEGECRKSAFDAKDNQLIICGSPRNDALYRDFENQEMFMEEDFQNIKKMKNSGKMLIFYVPTWRDTQKDISNWLKSQKLADFLNNNNAVLVCKLHPFDTNSLNFDLSENFYKMNSQSDLYPVLKYMDAMITDFSSVYFDYLLLDRPILYYIPDLEEYQEKCRGFYEPYENLTAGIYARNEDELLTGLNSIVNRNDEYKGKRKLLRDRMFVHQDDNNCERILNFITEANNEKMVK